MKWWNEWGCFRCDQRRPETERGGKEGGKDGTGKVGATARRPHAH